MHLVVVFVLKLLVGRLEGLEEQIFVLRLLLVDVVGWRLLQCDGCCLVGLVDRLLLHLHLLFAHLLLLFDLPGGWQLLLLHSGLHRRLIGYG